MDKEILIRNFSRSARTYDKYSDIQNKAAAQLLGLISSNGFKQILEIGCGTGNYTRLLRDKFQDAKLSAIDISADMIEVASAKFKVKEVEFKVGDGENIDLGKRFDLITSNACFQWFENLETALKRYADFLNARGLVIFSIFGNATFEELNESLKSLFSNAVRPVRSLSYSNDRAAAFNGISRDKLRFILENDFSEVQVEEFIYEEKFARLKDLLLKIKYTGIRGDGWGNKTLLTLAMLNKLENKYLEKFKEIKATYQIFYCRAWKKGEKII